MRGCAGLTAAVPGREPVRRLFRAGAAWGRFGFGAAAAFFLAASWEATFAQTAPAQPAPQIQPAPAVTSQATPGQTAPAEAAKPPADSAPAKLPEFSVASIKPDKSGSMGVRIMFGPDNFTATNIPLKMVIREAFDVNDDQVTGEPGWIDSDRYDIDAKVDSSDVAAMKDLSFDQRKAMVRALLVERFGLKYHQETRDLPVYALVVAKGGPKLHEAKPGDTYPNGFKGPDGKAGGAGLMSFNAQGQLTAQGIELSGLVRILSQQTGRTVLDKTGLTGKYDFTLQMPPMHGPMPMPHAAGAGPPGADDSADDNSGPSIFTALQDQMGLKLESQKAPLPVFVIDHIEQPSEN